MDAPQVRMSAVFAALLSIAAVGCGCPEPMELTENREGTLVAAQVAAARDENSNDEARCAWACQRYLKGAARDDGEVTACEATGVDDYVDAPWDPANTQVTIECTIVSEEPGFCTGRRPLGHREAGGVDGSRGAWLAGIDVSKDKLDVAVKEAGTDDKFSPAKRAAKVWTTSNTAKGHGELARRLKELGPERIALEATGGHFWNFLNDPTGTDFQPQVVEIAALVEQMYVSGGLSPANAFSRLTTALNTAGFAFWNDHWSSRATTHGVIDP